MKELKDYISFYVGSMILYHRIGETEVLTFKVLSEIKDDMHLVKLILRPWSDLKVEEVKEMKWCTEEAYWIKKSKNGKINILYDDQQPSCFRPNEFLFLCSIGIDLFGLIDAGVAIDQNKYEILTPELKVEAQHEVGKRIEKFIDSQSDGTTCESCGSSSRNCIC